MAEIEFKNITKYFGATKVIENLNLNVREGEFLVLIGPSGCGKSTTLRLLAGLEELTAGDILIDGNLVNEVAPKDRNISMVFQNYALYPHMTVYENMAFGLKLRNYKKDEIKKMVMETAEILEIQDLMARKPKQLSGGQSQRVALGRAIVRKPKVFLFDEPLSNLDAKLRTQMRTEIKKLHTYLKTTMIYVTHDQTEAMTMGDRIVVMKDGIIHQIGTPMEVYNNPSDLFVAGFIGSPKMNLVETSVDDNGMLFAEDHEIELNIPEETVRYLKKCDIKKVIVGIRPEDIFLENMSACSNPISGKIELLEPLGYETLLNVKVNNITIVCKWMGFIELKQGDSVSIYFNLNKLKYFNVDTHNVL
ncbi:MAG: ABC transporter ATP-binding protein [Candidatus Marinimicrobia bacterium]|nr:ABC transporter ATP-binding protein [Candidatus Neomarinimicrobiota bacterium]